jgi:hypothetical protein
MINFAENFHFDMNIITRTASSLLILITVAPSVKAQSDDGFETLFEQVKLEVGDHKELYHNQIERLQKLIRDITAAGSRIQTQEHDNKSLAEKYFSYEREKMTAGKKNSIAAFNYYQTMSKSKDIPPQFMDQKN